MKYIKSYEDQTINSIINYIDTSINESGIDIWNNTIRKIKNLSSSSKKKILMYLVVSLMSVSSVNNVIGVIKSSNVDKETKEISLGIVNDLPKDLFKKGYEFKLSQKGWDYIREEEKLRLTAYSINDGMITIGWGHAEPKDNSNYKVGDQITKEVAQKLFKEDLKVAADGVRTIFKQWEKKGINVLITQDMFDALASIAFNAGVGGLRSSDTIKYLKSGKYKEAGETIKTLKVTDKFPGLATRREKESKMFLSVFNI